MANCPAMLTPGDYEMAQNEYQDDSKEYFVVKMTDSAYRAIDKFQRYANANRFTGGQQAQIKINGNSGVIHIPTLTNEEGRNFGFSVDAVKESLGCVQQTADGLKELGPISHRIRIHANDKVYHEKCTKFAMVGETERNKCTKVIKPNKDQGDYIVKKPITTLVDQHRNTGSKTDIGSPRSKLTYEHTPLSRNRHIQNTTILSGSGVNDRSKSNDTKSPKRGSSSDLSHSPAYITLASKPSTTPPNGYVISNNRASTGQYKLLIAATSTVVEGSVKEMKTSMCNYSAAKAISRRGAVAATKGSKASSAKCKKQRDITHCKIRERVLQLLSVRPYKKLELYSRLQNEGLRDCDRSAIGPALRDIALLRDNTYCLRRHLWNEVKEDWPFYSEQERQQLKRNKPQDLTPPINSYAPSLTPPSPPQQEMDSDSNVRNSLIRPSEDYNNAIPSRKQRISHVLTKVCVENHINSIKANTLVQPRNMHVVVDGTESSSTQSNTDYVTKETKGGKPNKKATELRKKFAAPFSDQGSKTMDTDSKKDKRKESEKQSTDPKNTMRKSKTKKNKEEGKIKTDLSEKSKTQESPSRSKETTRKSKSKSNKEEITSKTDIPENAIIRTLKAEKTVSKSANSTLEASKHVAKQSQHGLSQQLLQQGVPAHKPAVEHSTTNNNFQCAKHAAPQRPQQVEIQQQLQKQITIQEAAQHSTVTGTDTAEPQGFDFSSYTPITCIEQRRQYKVEFERDYEEYAQLLKRVEYVRGNFHALISQLQQLPPDSLSYEYIHQKIIEDYERVNSYEELQRKQRFDYLHSKLAYINKLVNDYDKLLTSLAEATAIETVSSSDTQLAPQLDQRGGKQIKYHPNHQENDLSSSDSDESSDCDSSDDFCDGSSTNSDDTESSDDSD